MVNRSLYKNCRELLQHNFNEIQVEGDLTYLIKDGSDVDPEILKKHWIEILAEYFNLTNDFSQKKFFRDKAELKYLELKLTVLEGLKPLTTIDLNKEQKEQVNKILKGYRVKDLDSAILGVKDVINMKVNAFNKSYQTETKSNFEDELAMFRLNGCFINRMDITVSEWVSLKNKMKQKAPKNGSTNS